MPCAIDGDDDTQASNDTLERVTSHEESNKSLRRKPTRNQHFDSEWEPFHDNHAFQPDDEEVGGSLWFMNPTRATYTYLGSAEVVEDDQGSDVPVASQGQQYADHSSQTADIGYKWTSRDNRKGRHALVVHQSSAYYDTLPPTTGVTSILTGIYRMGTTFSFGDISYLIAVTFTLAVVALLLNSILSVLPYIQPHMSLPSNIVYVEGALTVVGCSLFLISSFLTFIEAVNANRRGCFGWKREYVSFTKSTGTSIEHGVTTRIVPDKTCVHRTHNFANLFRKSNKGEGHGGASKSSGTDTKASCQDNDQWRWFPANHELWKHFIYDLGFVTCTVLLLSSAIYTVAGVAVLVSIVKTGGHVADWIRIPQLIAGLGFTTASVLFMLETQTRWHVPELRVIGWHISFWNGIGSIGFTMCAAFAIAGVEPGGDWAEHQFMFSFMWGSIGFLVGSVMQWYEAVDKHPVQLLRKHAQGKE